LTTLGSRLSWGLAVSLVVLLTMQWGVASFIIRHLTETQLASRLHQDAESLLANLRFDEAGTLQLDAQRVNTVYQRPFSGHYYMISVDGQREVSRSLWDEDLAVPAVKPGEELRSTLSGPDKQTLLAVSNGYHKQNRDIIVTVAQDLGTLNAGLRQFQLIYGAVSMAILIILLLVQRYIVRTALKPLETIRANMARLERGETDRIETLGPAEIAPLIAELNRLLATMGKRARRSREALGNLAHALRTRLTALNHIIEQPEIRTLPHVHISMQESVEAMRRIVERELKRARLMGDALPGQRVNLREEITILVQTLQLMYADKSPDISWSIAEGAHFVGDQEDILELLGNLLDNACKWCKEKVVLEVANSNGILFTIEDDGSGCELEELDNLTRRGFRADEAKPGSGLGLAIVRDIVESYGGTLSLARSKKLGGMCVKVELPGFAP
jgi:signal transduction histidine kinase